MTDDIRTTPRQHGYPLRAEDVPEKVRAWLDAARGNHDPDECWIYSKRRGLHRYSNTLINGHYLKTNRAILALVLGEVPAGVFACHRCDHPGCCNPNHLFPGSNLDNVRDRDRKNRGLAGPKHQRRVLDRWSRVSEEQRITFRRKVSASCSSLRPVQDPTGKIWRCANAAARALGVTQATIANRCRNGSFGWRYLDG